MVGNASVRYLTTKDSALASSSDDKLALIIVETRKDKLCACEWGGAFWISCIAKTQPYLLKTLLLALDYIT